MDNRLTYFMKGTGEDSSHRGIADYICMSADEMEQSHDWVQWAFPTPNKSAFNPNAPTLSFQHSQMLWEHGNRHFYLINYAIAYRWLGFLASEKNITYHNYLRISRLMEFIILVGMSSVPKTDDHALLTFDTFTANTEPLVYTIKQVLAVMYQKCPPTPTTMEVHINLLDIIGSLWDSTAKINGDIE